MPRAVAKTMPSGRDSASGEVVRASPVPAWSGSTGAVLRPWKWVISSSDR